MLTVSLNVYLYNKTRHSYIYIYVAYSQTAGAIGLKFFVDAKIFVNIFFFFFTRATPSPSFSILYHAESDSRT